MASDSESSGDEAGVEPVPVEDSPPPPQVSWPTDFRPEQHFCQRHSRYCLGYGVYTLVLGLPENVNSITYDLAASFF